MKENFFQTPPLDSTVFKQKSLKLPDDTYAVLDKFRIDNQYLLKEKYKVKKPSLSHALDFMIRQFKMNGAVNSGAVLANNEISIQPHKPAKNLNS